MQRLLHNPQGYNRCYLRLWFLNLSPFRHLLIKLSAAPSTDYDHVSLSTSSQWLSIWDFCFLRFFWVFWELILPPAVSLSLILAELDFLSRIVPILRMSNILLIVSWWSWWESHPCLKSYWTTSLPLLTEGIDSVIFSILWGLKTTWDNFHPTISDSHILVLVTYKS